MDSTISRSISKATSLERSSVSSRSRSRLWYARRSCEASSVQRARNLRVRAVTDCCSIVKLTSGMLEPARRSPADTKNCGPAIPEFGKFAIRAPAVIADMFRLLSEIARLSVRAFPLASRPERPDRANPPEPAAAAAESRLPTLL